MKKKQKKKTQMIEIKGRKGLRIIFKHAHPESLLKEKSLVGLKGKELKTALKKPFYVSEDMEIAVWYKNKSHYFVIPENYDWNGANVPPFAWLLIGQQKEPRFKLASCVHDFLCENHSVIDNDRYLSTLIFETLCEYFGRFNACKRWAMFHSVDNYQKVFGKDLKGNKWKRKH